MSAIVVVENVERSIENLPPSRRHLKAMRQVIGPIIAIALVLCAVFVPIAFISGRAVLPAIRADHRVFDDHLGFNSLTYRPPWRQRC